MLMGIDISETSNPQHTARSIVHAAYRSAVFTAEATRLGGCKFQAVIVQTQFLC
jgi:hypothetical protein